MRELRFHGDAELDEHLLDLAVNVRAAPHPRWLSDALAASLADLARYPDARPATEAVAARHGRPADEVLLTAGAAQAFTLLAQALRPRRAVVVHPQFTEPEAALAVAGHAVDRAILAAPAFELDPSLVPHDADLVMIGNPTNPTSVLHPAPVLAGLARPGRVLVVDEAFADTVPGEPASLASRRDLPGLVVVRSLTKTWGLAGLRIGYLLGPADLVADLATHAPLWSVSAPALAAAAACATPRAVAEARAIAEELCVHRAHLVSALAALPGVEIAGAPAASFVLVRLPEGRRVREALRERGFAVRRGETFPGLDEDWLRVAVREPAVIDAFVAALRTVVKGFDPCSMS
jgi:histidinol-phosphate aminotransferase